MQPESQKTPDSSSQPPSPSVDDLIAQANAQTYSFESKSASASPFHRFSNISRKKKIIIISSLVVIVITIIIIAVLSASTNNALRTPSKTVYGTADTNGDGIIDSKDDPSSIIQGDTNGDGVVDSRDDASSQSDVDGSVSSWWSNLVSKADSLVSSKSSETYTAADQPADSSSDGTTNNGYLDDYETDPSSTDTTSEAEFSDYEDTSQPGAVTTKSGTLLTVASWNVLRINNTGSNVKKGVKSILSSAQVVGLQEVSTTSLRDAVNELNSSTIGVYQPDANTPIVWNAQMYQKIKSGYKKISAYGTVKYATYVKLRNIANGQLFYVVNFHAVVGVESPKESCSSTVCKTYQYEMKELSKYVSNLKNDNIPVFVTGDYNANYRFDYKCSVSWYPCRTFKAIGLYSGYHYTNLAGIESSFSTINNGSQLIDYVFSWERSDVAPVSMQIIAPTVACSTDSSGQKHCWNNSDHKPVLFTVKLSN